jgi:hypothetical protein
MASTKTLATAFAVTVALALSGFQSSVAQPEAEFQNQGIREGPRPDQSLLEPQPPPDCAFKGPLSDPPTAEETRMKLDYEEQCYRHSEMIARTCLEQLQKSIEEATTPTSRQPVVETTTPASRQPIEEATTPTSRQPIEEATTPTSRQPVVETTTPTSRQPIEEATTPTSRREPKGERHTFVRHSSSGKHRTSVVRTASHLGYPTLGGAYYRSRYFGRGYKYVLREDQYEDAIKGGWLIETPREPRRLRAR